MGKWESIQTKTEADFIFNSLRDKIIFHEVKRIFSKDTLWMTKKEDYYEINSLTEPLYILFDNDFCLKIEFLFYSDLYMEYRKIKKEELEEAVLSDGRLIDLLNCSYDEGDWDREENGICKDSMHLTKHIDIKGKYGKLQSVKVIGFNHEYYRWVHGENCLDFITIPAGGDYFREIVFTLTSGVEIHVFAEDAVSDGYYDLEIKDPNKAIEFKESEPEKK